MDLHDLNKVEDTVSGEIEKLKVSSGTIRRIVGLVASGIAEIFVAATGKQLAVDAGLVDSIVGWVALALVVVHVGFQFWVAWKNNSLTKAAIIADKDKDAMKKGITEVAVEAVILDPEIPELNSDEVK